MARLTKAQKNIILLSILAVIFLLCFWIFVYLPQQKRLSSIHKEISYIDTQIAQINEMTGGSDLTEALSDFNARIRDMSAIFSSNDEEVIGSLSKEAKKLKIEIESIKPLEKQPVKDLDPSLNIEELPIAMQLSCEFKDLANYLKILREEFPVLIKMKRLEVKGGGEGKDLLSVNLDISAYLSKQAVNN